MAELAYGAGLRLMELLRLRVHHLDLERRQLHVKGGKGDKDRITMIPEILVSRLQEQLERLRPRYEEDRRNGLPGVWLPDGLEKKFKRAGERWEWQCCSRLGRRAGTRRAESFGGTTRSTVPFRTRCERPPPRRESTNA